MLKKIFAARHRTSAESSLAKPDLDRLPRHIGIIMDGNGRWATGRGLIRTSGHKAGVRTLKKILAACVNLNRPMILTVYAFSTENWKRPSSEVNFLMSLFSSFLAEQIDEMCEKNVRIRFIGRIDELPGTLPQELYAAQERTAGNTGVQLNVAVNYGGQDELVQAVRQIAAKIESGSLSADQIDGKAIEDNLYTAGLPPVDLMIRTSGDMRLSNFLLWQAAYAELWFTETNWPDFTPEEFMQAIADFQKRDRRFGGLSTAGK